MKTKESIKIKTVKQYADDNNVSVQAVYQSIKRGNLKTRKLGSTILIEV